MITNFTSSFAERALPDSIDAIAQLDADISAHWTAMTPKGLVTAIKLGDCDPYDIRNTGHIGRFVVALYDMIEMRRFGDPIVVRCGADLHVCGYSLAQLIETSLIAGHFAEANNSASLNIFSCKLYLPYRAASFCRSWFGATTVRVSVTLRQAAERGTGTLGRTAQLARDAYPHP